MLWLTLALSSYFLSALTATADKFLLVNGWKPPVVYAVYVGLLNCAALPFWFFDFNFLDFKTTAAAFVSGAAFFAALLFLYSAIAKGDISKIISIIGGLSAFLVLILSYVFLQERLSVFWLGSFVMLVGGAFLLSFEKTRKDFKFNWLILIYSLLSAFLFAFAFFFSKIVFLKTSFINGFIWARMGTLLLVILILPFLRFKLYLPDRKELAGFFNWAFALFIGNKALGAAAFVFLNYAIMLGSVTMINALRGVEYMFVFLLSFPLAVFLPSVFRKQFSPAAVAQRFGGVFLISCGVALLFFS